MRVPDAYKGKRLDVFLSERLRTVTRAKAQRMIAGGKVLREGHPVKPGARVGAGEEITVLFEPRAREEAPSEPLDILFEDAHLLALNKPPGILVHPSLKVRQRALSTMLERARPGFEAKPVHRLDQDTSGVVLFAKTKQAARGLGLDLERRRASKEYLALVRGEVEWGTLVCEADLVGREGVNGRQRVVERGLRAVTRFERLQVRAGRTLLRAVPHTGRFHQIRAHLEHLGHPLVGDKLYAPDASAPRHMLHARRLEVFHPATGEPAAFEAPLPPDFEAACG